MNQLFAYQKPCCSCNFPCEKDDGNRSNFDRIHEIIDVKFESFTFGTVSRRNNAVQQLALPAGRIAGREHSFF